MTSFVASPSSIWYALQTVIAAAVAAIFIMAIVSFLLAIWEFVRSEWEEESKKKWWNRIRFMMIGILLTIFFLFAFPLLVKYLGIEWYELFNAQNIFARIGELMNQILNIWAEAKNYYTQWSFSLQDSMDTTSQSVDYTL
jgi:formate hydrogenlyase subunit 3/multisubunit Na+/H+ antiporter MnhD subunit